jgi:hypothetical protein
MSAVVQLEDRVGAQLLLASMGAAERPRLANRYEILELRGRGARGLVCRVADLKLGRDVALKIYPPVDDPRIEAEVTREARALAKVEHPNIVRVIDFGRATITTGDASFECVYLCMEYIEGRSLRVWRSERQRTAEETLAVLHAAGSALSVAHAAGIVHRDFKPENVMIDVRGRVRVVDFGLASGGWPAGHDGEPVPDGGTATAPHPDRLTQFGVAIGTLEYMAPEARQGAADARSDQFSFAMTAWECITGVLPFEVHKQEWRAAGQIEFIGARELPSDIRPVLERALSFSPADRFTNMGALLRALRTAESARTRIVVGSLAGAGLLAAVGVTLAFALGGLALPGKADAPAQPGTHAECDSLAGQWYFDTVVLWSRSDWAFYGVSGQYALGIEVDRECVATVTVTKTGDSDKRYPPDRIMSDAKLSRATPTDQGFIISSSVELKSEHNKQLRHYRFEFEFSGDSLRGDWRTLTMADGEPGLLGVLVGGRQRIGTIEPTLAGQSCSSRCHVLCVDAAAAARCAERACAVDRDATIIECGAPPAESVIPPIAKANLRRGLGDIRAEPPAQKGPGCAGAAAALDGTWHLWTSGDDVPATLVIVHDRCEISATLSKDGIESARPSGAVDPLGGWLLVGNTHAWSLIGSGPAFGVDSSRRALAAYRVDPPTTAQGTR